MNIAYINRVVRSIVPLWIKQIWIKTTINFTSYRFCKSRQEAASLYGTDGEEWVCLAKMLLKDRCPKTLQLETTIANITIKQLREITVKFRLNTMMSKRRKKRRNNLPKIRSRWSRKWIKACRSLSILSLTSISWTTLWKKLAMMPRKCLWGDWATLLLRRHMEFWISFLRLSRRKIGIRWVNCQVNSTLSFLMTLDSKKCLTSYSITMRKSSKNWKCSKLFQT